MNESRRDFIKQVGKVALGATVLGSMDACSPENFQINAEYVFEHSNGAEAHKSGNEFTKRVGDILKNNIPLG
jgi:hypothetical protein